MIHLDTNFLIAALPPGSPRGRQVRGWLDAGEKVGLSVVAWAEFLCGPTTPQQVQTAIALFMPPQSLISEDAERAAELFNATGRRRGSLADCLIAATCLRLDAELATENLDDFKRFEPFGLRLAAP